MIDEKRYNMILETLRKWVKALEKTNQADKPMWGKALKSGSAVSPRAILQEVEDRTPEGKRLVEAWIDLAVQHIITAPMEDSKATSS